MTLFHVDWCPDCLVVRRKLADLGLTYDAVVVPDSRRMRTQVHAVSGQYYVPVLKDGELVLTETADILAYLDKRYRADRAGAAAATEFQSQARATPDVPNEDDEHPSCRIH
ncbi:glutathione S-transferase N-terminal domain-containing protein [Candidatus Nitrospira nitrificans]|uniref:Glutaredoxin (Modular protein) n=1 Tax=Candidatus Nitrospira nitrificans TaxID=1742973 RepID=A0A0S4LBG6_9BACT|nr:glutathione S-transferase N-terminal domain-containing protein [Candidatus Nitrospira nitrificans]CUS32466.1 Putative Glutaredoxin (modular protein) [Candidatus Nitrospira nitrificans]